MSKQVGNGGKSHDKQPASTPQKNKDKTPKKQPPLHFESNPPELERLVKLTAEGLENEEIAWLKNHRCYICDIDVVNACVSVMFETVPENIDTVENIQLQYLSYYAALPAIVIDDDEIGRVRVAIQKRQQEKEKNQEKGKDYLEIARLAAEKAENDAKKAAKEADAANAKTAALVAMYEKQAKKADFEGKEAQYASQINKLNKELKQEALKASNAYKELEQKDAERAARILELERELAEHKAATRSIVLLLFLQKQNLATQKQNYRNKI
jgi:hypothetical protein